MAVLSFLGGVIFSWVLLGLIVAGISIFCFVFWILMLLDCIKKKFKEDSEKIIWVLILIFAGIVGALIYYFIVKRKSKKGKR